MQRLRKDEPMASNGPSDHPSIGDLACGRLHRCGERRQGRCGADGQTAGRQVADVGGLHLLRPPNVEISPTILVKLGCRTY